MPNRDILHQNDIAVMSEVEFLARWRSVTGQPPSAMLDRVTMVAMLRTEYPDAFAATSPRGHAHAIRRGLG